MQEVIDINPWYKSACLTSAASSTVQIVKFHSHLVSICAATPLLIGLADTDVDHLLKLGNRKYPKSLEALL